MSSYSLLQIENKGQINLWQSITYLYHNYFHKLCNGHLLSEQQVLDLRKKKFSFILFLSLHIQCPCLSVVWGTALAGVALQHSLCDIMQQDNCYLEKNEAKVNQPLLQGLFSWIIKGKLFLQLQWTVVHPLAEAAQRSICFILQRDSSEGDPCTQTSPWTLSLIAVNMSWRAPA